jgi:hypothetical protein
VLRELLLTVCVLGAAVPVASAQDIQAIDSAKASKIAKLAVGAIGELKLPIDVAPKIELAAGIEGDKRAALIIPDANFSQESIAGLRDGEIVAVGMLMTHRLSPLVVERAIPAARQLQIDLAEGEQRAKISVWLVGLTKVAGQPALLLYGNAPSPLIVTTLVESEKSKDGLLAIDVERSGDQRAAFFLKIAGTHRAAIHVTGQD